VTAVLAALFIVCLVAGILDAAAAAASSQYLRSLCNKGTPATRDKYIQRLAKLLDFLGFKDTKEEKARAFTAKARADPNYAFNSVLKFFQSKHEQIDQKKMAIGTARNYPKSIKLFCDMLTCMYLG
jgi:hypothetical protein